MVVHRPGDDIRTPDDDGLTPMFRANREGHHHVVQWLKDMGAVE